MLRYVALSLLCLSASRADYPASGQTDAGGAGGSAATGGTSADAAFLQEQSSALTAVPPPPPYYSPHATYGPQDPIQQYVANYGGASLPVSYAYGPDPGYAIQTGIEGFLVPAAYATSPAKTNNSPFRFLSSFPKVFVEVLSRAGIYLLGGAGFLLLGGAFTAIMCTFTPFCTISFLGLGLAKESVRSFMTPDKITAATIFLKEAIDKYQSLQKDKGNTK